MPADDGHPPDEVLAEGRYLRLVKRGRWEFADRNNASGAVVILAVTDDDRIVLVEQFRVPLGKPVIELPAGLVGDTPGEPDDDYVTTAYRELLEETGYQAREMEILTQGPTSPGLSTEVVTILRARGLTKVHAGGGIGHEQITVHEPLLAEAHAWLQARSAAGVPVDPKVFAGLYFAGVAGPRR